MDPNGPGPKEELLALERVELSDSDDDFDYGEVALSDDGGESSEGDEDLETLRLRHTQASAGAGTALMDASAGGVSTMRKTGASGRPYAEVEVQPGVVDDFIRNFLIRRSLSRTLDAFNTEWFEKKARGQLNEDDINPVPNVYVKNAELDAQVSKLQDEVGRLVGVAAKAEGTWDTFRKERDFHRMHHKRVTQEKNRIMNDIKRLKKHYEAYEPTMKEMRTKYELAMKEKMLMRLERDRVMARVTALESQVKAFEEAAKRGAEGDRASQTSKAPKRRRGEDSKLPSDDAENPHLATAYPVAEVNTFQLTKTFKCHANAIAAVAFHPTQPILATVSDDRLWKMWTVPGGELVMSGDGHREWIAGVDFHPSGSHLATCSGDGLVKLWDFASASCAATFSDHTQAAWDVAFHHGGDFLVSCSMDHSCKLWDLSSSRCRQTLRDHVDSVNSVCFQPFSVNLCTGSGDKTVSLWDIRSGMCIQTFYGHNNAVNGVAFNLTGDTIGSCDADGIVKLWDVRMVAERATLDCGDRSVNKVCFDRSGAILAAASDDSEVKLFNVSTLTSLGSLRGHEDAVQAVAFDPESKSLVSAGADNSFRVWSPSA